MIIKPFLYIKEYFRGGMGFCCAYRIPVKAISAGILRKGTVAAAEATKDDIVI